MIYQPKVPKKLLKYCKRCDSSTWHSLKTDIANQVTAKCQSCGFQFVYLSKLEQNL